MLHETDLSGTWSFALGPQGTGVTERWFEATLADTIPLPGSVDQAQKTPLTTGGTMAHLARRNPYVGKAWYAREVEVATEADGMFHWLVLERPHGEVTVWLDGYKVKRDESLSTPNRFFLGPVAAGTHHLVLQIDNDRFEAVGDALLTNPGPALPDVAHSKTDHTQTNWNGVVGRIALEDGPTKVVPLKETRDLPLVPDRLPMGEYFDREVSITGKAGSLMIYRTDVLHRGSNITGKGRSRFAMLIDFQKRGWGWQGRMSWPDRALKPEMNELLSRMTPRQRDLFNWPAAGSD